MNERFGYSRKEKREIRQNNQNAIASDIWNKNKANNSAVVDRFDEDIFKQGESWFATGLSLEEAPDDKKNNSNFRKGFERAQRIANVEQSLYELGKSYYETGVGIEDIPERYKNNQTVLNGYNDSKNKGIGSK